MVQAVIKIKERTNKILNIVKAKYSLRDKSRAIDLVVSKYEEEVLEPKLRPEYIEKIKNIEKQGKFTRYESLEDLRREIENA